jgi:hypothetical protein
MFVELDGTKIERVAAEDPSSSDPRADLVTRGTRYALATTE